MTALFSCSYEEEPKARYVDKNIILHKGHKFPDNSHTEICTILFCDFGYTFP